MGDIISVPVCSYCNSLQTRKLPTSDRLKCTRPITVTICFWIIKIVEDYGLIFPNELIWKIIEFVGFIIFSNILESDDEKAILNDLLNEHFHTILQSWKFQQISSFLQTGYIKCFKLLYRSSEDGNFWGRHNNYEMIDRIKNIPHILIIFHTNYDHIFCAYLRRPVNQRGSRYTTWWIDGIYDDTMGLFLLKSKFIYGLSANNPELHHRICPRIINKNPMAKSIKGGSKIHLIALTRSNQCLLNYDRNMTLGIMNVVLQDWCHPYPHLVKATRPWDFVGNELCGGVSFHANDNLHYPFDLRCVEAYQIS